MGRWPYGAAPTKHANEAERARQYRKRKKRHETSSVTANDGRDRDESGFVTPTRDETRDETPLFVLEARQRLLLDAAEGNADPAADIGPIEALLDQGCNFEMDVLPVVAGEVQILAAREHPCGETSVSRALGATLRCSRTWSTKSPVYHPNDCGLAGARSTSPLPGQRSASKSVSPLGPTKTAASP
jgi:hypothetical protein